MMEISEIIKGLRVCGRDNGCRGCPLENHPEIPGNLCDGQLMREAADNLEKLNDFEHSQLAIVMAENAQLRAVITQNDPDFFTRLLLGLRRFMQQMRRQGGKELMEELKACPFCGGKAEVIRQWKSEEGTGKNIWIRCKNCGVETVRYDTDKEAAAKWNRRAAPENEPLTMERLRQMDGEPVWVKPTKGIAKWYLVDVAEEGCADCDMGMVDFELYGSQQSYGWLAYASKPEGSAS